MNPPPRAPDTVTAPSGLNLAVHPLALFAMAFVLCLHLAAILTYDGPVDDQGFLLNTSKCIPLNVYEDDGIVNVYLGLGFPDPLPGYRSYAIDLGGPFLHLGRFVLAALNRAGLIVIFDDPQMYWMYPAEFQKIWKAYALYKLLFVVLAPLALYWIGANFFSPAAGVLAAWCFAVMPFVPGFELRLKMDTPTLVLGLLSILCQLACLRRGSRRHLLLAALFLGLSLSAKIVLLPACATLALVHVLAVRRGGERLFGRQSLQTAGLAALVLGGAYLLANPLFLAGFRTYLAGVTGHVGQHQQAGLTDALAAIGHRLARLDIFYGPALALLAGPALLLALYRAFAARPRLSPEGFLLLLFALEAAYFGLVFKKGLTGTPYYFYTHAVLLLPLMGSFLAEVLYAARARPLAALAAKAGIVLLLAAAAREQYRVMAYMAGPTDREKAHAFMAENLPAGGSVGLPLPPGDGLVSSLYRVDPFRWRVLPVGREAELAATLGPDMFPFALAAPMAPAPEAPGYAPAARFAAGEDLPHERYDFFQEEPFFVFARERDAPVAPGRRRDGPGGPEGPGRADGTDGSGGSGRAAGPLPGDPEFALGQAMRQDPEQGFHVLSFEALRLFPISPSLWRKTGDTLAPMPLGAFSRTARHASSPLAHVHQVDPAALALWGVKYLAARLDPGSSFAAEVLPSPDYRLAEIGRLRAAYNGAEHEVGLFRNADYRGQALFLPDPPEGAERRAVRRAFSLLGPTSLPTFGTLHDRTALRDLGARFLEVRLTIETDGLVDVILKGGDARRSFLLGPGFHRLHAPYRLGAGGEDPGFEINPVTGSPKVLVLERRAAPLALLGPEAVRAVSSGPDGAFARLDAPRPGRVVFALPDHGRWRAAVDGRPAAAEPGPLGTVAVRVPAGPCFVSLAFAP